MSRKRDATLPDLHQPGEELLFVPLGGAGEIGMNLSLFGCRGKWLIVDLGVSFGDAIHPSVDVVMPDPAFIEQRRRDLLGILITHAHEDHLGAVTYLWPRLRVPIYATRFAAEFLKVKLEEEGIEPIAPIHVLDQGGHLKLGPFDMELVSLTHSIPEPNAVAIRTPFGTVLHTGDWKFDPEPLIGGVSDTQRLKAIGDEGVLAMVCDSTGILVPGHSGSEAEVRKTLVRLMRGRQGRIAVACFASNVARVDSVARAAEANGRRVALVGRSLWRITDVARRCGYLQGLQPFLSDEEGSWLPDEKVVFLCTGSQGEGRAALARIAQDDHPHVSFGPGDVVIFSSRIIPGNEKPIMRLQNMLVELGAEVITDREAMVHVSGHPSQGEVEEMYRLVRPRVAVPVHGEARHMHTHAALALEWGSEQAMVAPNGSVLRLAPGPASIIGEVPVGRLVAEGSTLLRLDSPVFKERRRMAMNGAVALSLVLDIKGKLMTAPRISMGGMPEALDENGLDESLVEVVSRAVRGLSASDRKDDGAVAEAAWQALRRALPISQRKRPLAQIHVLRV